MYLSSFDIKKPPSSVEARARIGGTNRSPIIAAKYIVETGIKNISITPIISKYIYFAKCDTKIFLSKAKPLYINPQF